MNCKKILALLLACITTGGASISAHAAEDGIVYDGDSASFYRDGAVQTGLIAVPPSILIGDLDENGSVNAPDAAYILTAAVEAAVSSQSLGEVFQKMGLSENAAHHGDCDRDTEINAVDAAMILVHAAAIGAGESPEPLCTAHYFADAQGILQKGWILQENAAYYAGEDYALYTNGRIIDNQRCDFDVNGALRSGWVHTEDASYYYSGGEPLTGIQQIYEKSLYFHPETGALVCGETVNGVTTDEEGRVTKVLLDTPYISQIGYPTGCESASAVMLLRDAGYDTSIDTFIDEALDIGSLSSKNGKLYGPHPSEAFIGDPRSSSGFGCYAPVITRALNRILKDGDTAVDLTGTPLSQLLTDYIDKGQPVAVWATINMVESTPGREWYTSDGSLFTWKRSEHCLVLVGYDAENYYMNDPYKGNGLKAYPRSKVEARYEFLESQAVIIAQESELA